MSIEEYYSGLRDRYETHLKFARLFTGTAVPATLSGPQEVSSGALAGLPLAVSPDIDVAGCATHAGCETLRVATASADATVVKYLKKAGAHLLGQTTGSELGMAIDYASAGIAKNPYSAFGISGGSVAAAVAARAATVGVSVDLIGGSRVSAALCGVAAFRPTHGRYDASGSLALSSTLSSLTLVARTVRDLQLLDAVITSNQKTSAKLAKVAVSPGVAEVVDFDEATSSAIVKIQALGRSRIARVRLEKDKARVVAAETTVAAADAASMSTPTKTPRQSYVDAVAAEGADRLALLELGEGDALAGADGPGSPGSPTPKMPPKASSSKLISDVHGLRIGVPRSSALFQNMTPAVAVVIDAALSRLSKAGAILVDVSIDMKGSLGEDTNIAESAAAIANTLLSYEAPREIAAYAMSRSVPAPVAPKPAGEEEEAPEDEDGEKKAPPAPVFVPLDSLVTASKIVNGYKGPAPQKSLLAAQLTSEAVKAEDYRAALIYKRPLLKQAFSKVFETVDVLVYPATLLPAISPRGTEGASVDFAGSVAVRRVCTGSTESGAGFFTLLPPSPAPRPVGSYNGFHSQYCRVVSSWFASCCRAMRTHQAQIWCSCRRSRCRATPCGG